MIDRGNFLPLTRQASLLRLSRSSVYYLPRPVPPARLAIMRRIDALHLEYPFAGSRMLRDMLRREGITIDRLAVATLMRRMSIEALCVRRVRFVMISPDLRQHRRCQAGIPLIRLSEFPEPPQSRQQADLKANFRSLLTCVPACDNLHRSSWWMRWDSPD